jgi:ubiquinone/menaquinone biosynthesis C-methylase UbiE
MADKLIAGNYFDKYNSKNPIVRHLINGFYSSLSALLKNIKYNNVLDTGCGEAFLTNKFFLLGNSGEKTKQVVGLDLSFDILSEANNSCDVVSLICGNMEKLPFHNSAFDLVVANEALEHVENPQEALDEIERVGSSHFIISVPREPIWRFLNLCRLRYVLELGNTPGHINHWSVQNFLRLLACHFEIMEYRTPLPWIMVLCKKRRLPN